MTTVLTLTKGVDYTTEWQDLVGEPANLGDIVCLGIEPTEPYGRIVGFDHTKQGIGSVIVQPFNGNPRGGYLGGGYAAYCRRDDWDGPTPNRLRHILWREP